MDLHATAARAFRNDDAAEVRRLLGAHPELRALIHAPVGEFATPPVTNVRSRAMLDVLLEAGADINARSRWWAGGFGLLDQAPPDVARYALERGARLTAHAAARLGMLDELRALVDAGPAVVGERGGDGQMPLHFASTPEVADFLLDRGAEIDARDIDHESTAAQWMSGSRQAVARRLVERGCWTDILLAAALGARALAERLVREDPECLRKRVTPEYFPMVGEGGKGGGSIYQWELGWYLGPCEVARKFGHEELFQWLEERCPAEERLLAGCWLHDEDMVRKAMAEGPVLTGGARRHLAHAARNNDTEAVRLMLAAGLPVDAYSQHHATALHWAAWQGNAVVVRMLLERDPPLEDSTNEYGATPLGWARHGRGNSWRPGQGDYDATEQALKAAGAKDD